MLMKQKTIAIMSLIIVASILRLIPHPPNMTPIVGMSVLSVSYFNHRLMQFGFPLFIMLITDAIIGFHPLMPNVYVAIILSGLSGYILKKRPSFVNMIGASFVSSILFFVITNMGVWFTGTMYAKTFSGLTTCFIAALPFFHNTVIATLSVIMTVFFFERLIIKLFIKTEKSPFTHYSL